MTFLNVSSVSAMAEQMGFLINHKKYHLSSTQTLNLLGLSLDSVVATYQLSTDNRKSIMSKVLKACCS